MIMNSQERYEETFSIVSYEADYEGYLSLFSLFNRFQELAGLHAAFLQVGYNTLRNAGLAWILSRMKVQIVSMPRWTDTGTSCYLAKGDRSAICTSRFLLNKRARTNTGQCDFCMVIGRN